MENQVIRDQIKNTLSKVISSYKEKYEKVIIDPCANGSINVIGGNYEFSHFHQKIMFVEKSRKTISSNKLEELVDEYRNIWGVNLHAFPA